MKHAIDYPKKLDGVLAIALIILLAGCGFALFHAFAGASASSSLIAAPFVPI
jgi:outer membrane lipopolysaccharide assembly protein LptE/RlpB